MVDQQGALFLQKGTCSKSGSDWTIVKEYFCNQKLSHSGLIVFTLNGGKKYLFLLAFQSLFGREPYFPSRPINVILSLKPLMENSCPGKGIIDPSDFIVSDENYGKTLM